ncbi:MAG TPA: SPOR domain-containing protein [Rhodocyclaceae bacterium]|nr:SPOR domain-containing protein [Rhodocyclaceae bacterium]
MAQIDPAEDGQLELKKRARRRLVGAVALALAAVIVLPMVMDQEPKPLTQDIQIRIPSQDTALARPLAAPPAAMVQPETVKSPAALAAPVEPGAAPPVPPASGAAAPAKPASKVQQATGASDAKPEGERAAVPHDAQWILQLGAYEDQANVRLLLAKLKELGYPSYTEKVQTEQGPRTRVRGGPFATRRAAEAAQARLKKIGAGGPPGGVVAQKQ